MIRKVKGRTFFIFHLSLLLKETLDKVYPLEDPINVQYNKDNNNQVILKCKAFLTQIAKDSGINDQYTIYPMHKVERNKHVSTVEITRELGIDHKIILNHLHKAGYNKERREGTSNRKTWIDEEEGDVVCMLLKIYNKKSNIQCALIVYALDNIISSVKKMYILLLIGSRSLKFDFKLN
ncbi:hypothetical protein ALC53_11678 [Atta colombica]|uniref:Histone-lysine N-methyltransferase SETMAR n=1 Tax=Atta colombica TaxID=520822 RepID=A0A195AZK1_9HYME|nr:hypothetical protein ALC53_11678 [Atta colombica]